MKVHSSALELRTLKAVCKGGKASTKLLGRLNEDLFHTEAGSAAFTRLSAQLKASGEVPDWELLIEDPVLSVGIRRTLKKFKKRPIDAKKVKKTVERLAKYRTMRTMLYMAENIFSTLQEDKVDVDVLVDESAQKIASARVGKTNAKMWNFGKNDNTAKLIDRLLSKKGVDGIPTGFKVWDRRNGVLPRTAAMLIAGNTGGGKSILAGEMAARMAAMGYEIALASLEMGDEEIAARYAARASSIPVNKILQGKKGLSKNERKVVRKSYAKWIEGNAKAGGRVRLFNPEQTPTMTELLYALKAFSPDAIIVDYIALLDGVDGDDDWRKLSEAMRTAKRFAKAHKIPVIVLAQLSDEGKLLYAKRMLHDADLAWFWIADEEAKESGYVYVRQPKARNLDPTPFWLKMEWPYTRVADVSDEERESSRKEDGKKKDLKGKKKIKLKDLALANLEDL